MSNKLVRSVARYALLAGSTVLSAACGAADGTNLEEEALVDQSEEGFVIDRGCGPACPLPDKIIDCQATPHCEECCSGLACRSVPCCNPYVNNCKVTNKRAITNDFSLPPTHGETDSLPAVRR